MQELLTESFSGIWGDSNDKNAKRIRARDGREYKVQKNLENPNRAADILAELNSIITTFIAELIQKHPNDPRAKRVYNRYNPATIMEGSPFNKEGSTSYSMSKGKKIVFCIRSKKNSAQFHNTNLLVFVVIHELAHLSSSSYGHNDEFHRNFKWLLENAVSFGIYQKIDFYQNNQEYCGMTIKTTPI